MKHLDFPLAGEIFKSPQKKFDELVFFVHFFNGNKKLLRRHIDFVNTLGFDAFAFNLHGGFGNPKDFLKLKLPELPISSKGKLGVKHVYADQIEQMMNLLPQKKIVYAFSNPAASAIEALALRQCSDVVALICDSGPSSKLMGSLVNLIKQEFKINFLPARIVLSPVFAYLWDIDLHETIHADLQKFPPNFPILSIRGWKDPLISPSHIDALFEPHDNLNWQKLNLPEAAHLNGMKDFSAEYKAGVQKFLGSLMPSSQ